MSSSRSKFDEFRSTYREKRADSADCSAGKPAARPSSVATIDLKKTNGQPTLPVSATSPSTTAPRRGYLREYIAWLRPFTWQIVTVFAFALAAALLSLIMPGATMYIVDTVLPAHNAALLHQMGFALLGIILAQQTLDILRNWRTATLNARVVFRLRQKLFNRLLRLPLHEISQMKTGGITARLSGDVDSMTGLVQMGLISPAVSTFKVLLTIGALLWINWRMALAAVLLLPPIILLNMTYIRRIRPIYSSMRKDRGEIDGRVVETFGGIRVVRAFGREAAEAIRYAVGHHSVIRKQLFARLFESAVWAGWGFLIPLSALFIIWVGGSLVLAEKATIGGILAFQMYLLMLMSPVSNIVQSYGETQQALAALERVFDILRRPVDKPDRPAAVETSRRVDSFSFENVTFGYNPQRPVLKNVSLEVRGGWTVALVGPSGSGKTTMTNLVARFYDPDEGAVRLNGVDLRDIKLRSYRNLLGLVSQDVFLFDGSIAENIAYGRRDATPIQIEAAARRANAHEFITAFPEGYATIVGERGVRLSGGQAQRVSIARALLADPQILILDEATSNLDSESEHLIQAALRELLTDRTTFIIAHRLSTVVHADLIVVLEDGQITESGTHVDLMAAETRYRDMVLRQRRGASLDPATDGALLQATPQSDSPDWLA